MKVIVALSKFFRKSGQTPTEFLTELKQLSHEERQELGRLAAEAMNEPFEAEPLPIKATN